jgi:hypothetical protein
MRNVLVAAVVLLTANAYSVEDAPEASGNLDGKRVKFPEKSVADGVKATVGLLESCHSESLYQADEFKKALQGDHIRLAFAKPITARVNNDQIEFSELVFRLPMNTGVFWVRTGDKWRRYSKYEFEKEKPFAAWLREANLKKNDDVRHVPWESSSHTSIHYPPEARDLDQMEQKRLRISWDKPKRKVKNGGRYSRPELEISGKLSLLQEDGKTLKPVDWPLPVRVVLSLRPNEKPDWTRWHDRKDCTTSDTLVGWEMAFSSEGIPKLPPGVFIATFQLSNFPTPIGAMKPFQVGLCLGEKKGQTLTWRNRVPVLPQSVEMLEVPGPKPISRTLQLINACPTPIGWNFDSIALVRAANHLRSLGKDKAIAALREFLEVAYDTGYSRDRIDPENIDTSNQWCLASLVPLVFDGVDQDLRIGVWQGIPFHTMVIHGTSGWPPSVRPLLREAQEHGKLIQKPLRPTNDPLEAADSAFKKIVETEKQKDSEELLRHLRAQVWRGIRHLVDPQAKETPDLSSKPTWDKLKAKAASLKIRWDEKRQEFVAGEQGK